MRILVPAILAVALLFSSCVTQQPKESLDTYLSQGRQAEALKVYRSWGDDPQTHFETGVITLLDGLRDFAHDLLTFAKPEIGTESPVVASIPRQSVTYAQLVGLLANLKTALSNAADQLERGGAGNWKVELHPLLVRFDLNKDGRFSDDETAASGLALGLGGLMGHPGSTDPKTFVIEADPADSYWLAGYCRLITAGLDLVLAYDWHPLYNAFAGEVFDKVADAPTVPAQVDWPTLKIQPVNREQGKLVRSGLLRVLELSRYTMNALAAETDNDHEWIPSAKQDSVTGLKISAERWAEWPSFLTDARAILEGKLVFDFEGSAAKGLGLNVERILADLPPLSIELPAYLKDRYLTPIPPGKLVDGQRDFWHFVSGEGLLYAFFIN